MVEMQELANILNNITERSLVILDEIGRGTSTIDGFSIAKAVLEYLHGSRAKGPRTLFATHFHQLIDVEASLKHVKNYHFAVKETGSDVVFLRKIIPGATDKSYGIHVARLAGVPAKVTQRAEKILQETVDAVSSPDSKGRRYTQMLLISDNPAPPQRPNPAVEELKKIDPDLLTPLTALEKIYELKRIVGEDDT